LVFFPPPVLNFDQKPCEGRLALLALREKEQLIEEGLMTGRDMRKLTRGKQAWYQKGSHGVKRDDMR